MQRQDQALVAVSEETFERTVLEAQRPVLLDFSAEWCGPCVAVEPVIRDLASEYADRLTVGTVDVDEEPELAAHYGVRSLPTVLLIEGGRVRRVLVGARSRQEYRAAIEGLLH